MQTLFKFSLDEKKEIIRMMIRFINEHTYNGFCKSFFESVFILKPFTLEDRSSIEVLMLISIPELEKYKPIHSYNSVWWFDRYDKETRIKILKQIYNQL